MAQGLSRFASFSLWLGDSEGGSHAPEGGAGGISFHCDV